LPLQHVIIRPLDMRTTMLTMSFSARYDASRPMRAHSHDDYRAFCPSITIRARETLPLCGF
jgi:hypothetical protein